MTKHDERIILVTGSTGTVGSEVVKQLASPSVGYSIIKAAVHSQDKSNKFKGYDSGAKQRRRSMKHLIRLHYKTFDMCLPFSQHVHDIVNTTGIKTKLCCEFRLQKLQFQISRNRKRRSANR